MNDYEEHRRQRAARVAAVTHPRIEARVAAKWWANQVRQGQKGSSGDGHLDGFMVGMAALVGDSARFPARVIDTFEAELAAGIEAEIVERRYPDEWGWYVSLGCDYHPDTYLVEAADRAGMDNISAFVFPIKTTTWVDRGKVRVSAGYGSHDKTVWVSVEGALHWADESMERCSAELRALADGADQDMADALRAIADGIKREGVTMEPREVDRKAYCKGINDAVRVAASLAGATVWAKEDDG